MLPDEQSLKPAASPNRTAKLWSDEIDLISSVMSWFDLAPADLPYLRVNWYDLRSLYIAEGLCIEMKPLIVKVARFGDKIKVVEI